MEKYITEEKRVLTRVEIKAGEALFVVESIYSDTDLLDKGMQCIDSALSYYNVDRSKLLSEISKVLNGEPTLYDPNLPSILHIKVVMEQYGDRHICESNSPLNFISKLIQCFKSCAILSTYSPGAVQKFLEEYVEEYTTNEEDDK